MKHSERSHALLSASGAKRWINCPPSARLEEEYGEKKTSTYAAEGTLAHEISELFLRHDVLNTVSDADFDLKFEELINNELFAQEMLDYVPIYTDYCRDQLIAAKATNTLAFMELEQKLDLTEYVPESFGTGDCIIVNDTTLEVIDLKYGKGVPVYAEWNAQLMLYALGALRKYDTMYDITEVRMTIVQPRLNNISSFVMPVEELIDWAVNELRPAALQAHAGEGELNVGDWCRFCAVKNQCRQLYEKQMELARFEFSKPDLLTDEEISEIIQKTPKLIEWLNSIVDWAHTKAVKDYKQWPGLKLVEGTSRRKWIADEDKVAQTIFEKFPELGPDDIYVEKLIGLTDMQKLVGKKRFEALLTDVLVKSQGKPTLVSEDDPRPAMGTAQAQIDFSE